MKLKPGVHRCVARDGTVAILIVGHAGELGEFMCVGQVDPPRRPTRRWLGPDLPTVIRQREAARMGRIVAALEAEGADPSLALSLAATSLGMRP